MGAPSHLPARLRYLQPVRKRFATMRAEEINESMDQTLLDRVRRKRVKDLSVEKARTALNGDRAALRVWLAQPGLENDGLNFVVGFLLIAAETPEHFLVPPTPTVPPDREVRMDLPERARGVDREAGTLGFLCGKLRLYVCPIKEEEIDLEVSQFRAQAKSYGTA